MMVDPNANLKKGGSKYLEVVREEILDVIQDTSKKHVLCRNRQGKCESHTPPAGKYMLLKLWLFSSVIKTQSTEIRV